MINPLLSVQNLRIELTTRDGVAPVIDDFSFDLFPGEAISFVCLLYTSDAADE